MKNKTTLENIFSKFELTDFKWINTDKIIVANWVRMKCQYGCSNYGKSLSCPPNSPPISDCKEFFREYQDAVLFHFPISVEKPEDRFSWSKKTNEALLKIEREVFLSGYHKAFILPVNECSVCEECVQNRVDCKLPKVLRPVPESMGVDLFATARGCGYPIDVLTRHTDEMNRYAILLVE